jgi:hypothetical protein
MVHKRDGFSFREVHINLDFEVNNIIDQNYLNFDQFHMMPDAMSKSN